MEATDLAKGLTPPIPCYTVFYAKIAILVLTRHVLSENNMLGDVRKWIALWGWIHILCLQNCENERRHFISTSKFENNILCSFYFRAGFSDGSQTNSSLCNFLGLRTPTNIGVARAFQGGWVTHSEGQNEDKSEENLRKNKKKWWKFEKN